jgi:hypothetical protein
MLDHRRKEPHDCTVAGGRQHECKPLTASSVRQIHAVISGALSAAVRWDRLPFNPAETARIPREAPAGSAAADRRRCGSPHRGSLAAATPVR